jgi:hypothetical protein
MSILLRILKGFGRLIAGLMTFVGLTMAWTGLLFVVNPWTSAGSGEWPGSRPVAVTSGVTNKTRVILFRNLADETKADPSLVPWPATASGSNQDGDVHTTWATVSGKKWQYEVSWDDRDHLLESRYRLDGKKPVLIEDRGRDPGLAFKGIILAIFSIVVLKIVGWSRRKKASKISNEE